MIVELDRFEQEVRELEKKLDETASAFDVDAMRDELDQLHREMEQPDFWNNLERAQKVNQRIKTITDRTQGIADLRAQCEDAHTLIAMCDEEQDESLVPEIESEIQDLTQKIGALAMDVFEDETEIYHHRRINDIIANRSMAYLRQFPNVILTQHMAFYTDVNTRSMVECGLKGIVELAAGRSQGL